MLFYSMLNSENKTYDCKCSPNHVLKSFIGPFCTKEMPYFAHWIANKKSGIKL